MPIKKRTQQYPADFRTQAIQLAITSGKSKRVVADELGVGTSTLAKWVKQHRPTPDAAQVISPISGVTTQQALEQENRRLKRELEIVRQEREILKAATKFFARENQ